jgi:hypothetical protein
VLSIIVPVIVRIGPVDQRAGLREPVLSSARLRSPRGGTPEQRPVLRLKLVREGANSIYGDVEVWPGQPRQGQLLGALRGVAVYPEIHERAVQVALARPPAQCEPVTVVFLNGETRRPSEMTRMHLRADQIARDD